MAEVLLGQSVNMLGRALFSGRVRNITKSGPSSIEGQASFSARAIRIMKSSKGTSLGRGVVTVSTLTNIIAFPSSSITGRSLFSAKKPVRYRLAKTSIQVSGNLEVYRTDRDIRQDMNDALPKYYDTSVVKNALVNVEANEFVRMTGLAYEVLDQFFPETATWAIPRWEAVCGFTPDDTLTLAYRRSRVLQKIKGHGTITLAYFKTQANLFYPIEVVEYPRQYKIVVKVEMRAVPEALRFFTDLTNLLNSILPAHVSIEYEFEFAPWQEILDSEATWDDLNLYSWKKLPVMFYAKSDLTFALVEGLPFAAMDQTIWESTGARITNEWEVENW